MKPIVVINPNSTESVTEGMREAVQPLRLPGGPPVECLTLTEGPPGIETDAHVQGVIEPILRLIREKQQQASAFVIGCYSDPGLREAREESEVSVFGIAESAMLAALTRGTRFGVISILEETIPRHQSYVRELGLEARLAGDRAIGLGVTELEDPEQTVRRMVEVATRLRDDDGSDVLILGCAGMARHRKVVERAVGLPVVEPTQAATLDALGATLLA